MVKDIKKQKKRLTKREKETLDTITNLQISALKTLKMNANKLISSAEDTIVKIEQNGIDGYYSVNHDCQRYANDLWRSSHYLGTLRRLKEDIVKEIKKEGKN
tara:strand:- start:5313 stop:5618 length:306 start_codon:yes stop_codon:yes gene_type:complete